jgi:alpha-tubulin suppressor-like RCC1 family protein
MKAAGYARRLFTCGNGETGKLGLGGVFSTTLFSACNHLPDVDVCAVSCGNAHTAIVTACGSVFTCGSNEQLQLGHSKNFQEVPLPLEVDIPERIVSVSAGGAFNLALSDSGDVFGARLPFCKTLAMAKFFLLLEFQDSVCVVVTSWLSQYSEAICA